MQGIEMGKIDYLEFFHLIISVMKTNFTPPLIFLVCFVVGLVQSGMAQQNLITNGNMEARNHAPQGYGNIGPNRLYDDLQNWYRPANRSYDMSPDYIAADGAPDVNTATAFGGSFTPHSGIGCVGLSQHDSQNSHCYDEFITQQLNQPLVPGHSYRVEFWALRRSDSPWETRLSFSITNGNPTFDCFDNTLYPSPGSKTITSGVILDRRNWTLVTGIINIPLGESTNQWVSIGYDRIGPSRNESIPSSGYGIYYAIDDVALYDLGCGVKVSGNYYCNSGCPSYPPTQGSMSPGNDFYTVPAGTYTVNIGTNTIGANVSFWTWSIQSDGPYTIGSSGNKQGVFTLNAGQRAQFTVSGDVAGCGRITRTFTLLARSAYYYAYAPNPTSDELTVAVVDGDKPATAEPSATAPPFEAELYDRFGKKVKTKKSEKGKAKLDVRDVPAGLYNLRVGKSQEAISEHIQITH